MKHPVSVGREGDAGWYEDDRGAVLGIRLKRQYHETMKEIRALLRRIEGLRTSASLAEDDGRRHEFEKQATLAEGQLQMARERLGQIQREALASAWD